VCSISKTGKLRQDRNRKIDRLGVTPAEPWGNAGKFGVTLVEISALRLWKIIENSVLPQSFGA